MAMAQRNLTETEENVVEALETVGPLLINKLEVCTFLHMMLEKLLLPSS